MTPLKVLVLILTSLALFSCSGKGGNNPPPIPEDENVPQVVATLLSGDDDFSGMSALLAAGNAAGDPNARMIKGVVDLLANLKASGTQPSGNLYGLFTRAGLVAENANGSFWDFKLIEEAHLQGAIKNDTPRLDELVDYLMNGLKPALRTLVDVLDSMPPNFELALSINTGGRFFSALDPADAGTYVLDYGDVMVMACNVHLLLAEIDMIVAVDWNNVAPNDFDDEDYPNRDFLAWIDQNYTHLGNILLHNEMLAAKVQLRAAWQSYLSASSHLRQESEIQQAEGILTLGSGSFGTMQERDDFLADEQSFRNWAQAIVDAFDSDSLFEINTAPDGTSLPVEDRIQINFLKFFNGVNARDIYFKILQDPLENDEFVPGVNGLAGLTSDMLTFGGVIGSIGGETAAAGDLQGVYAVRTDNPATDTKVINGDFSDWVSGSTQIAASPGLNVPQDLGRLWVAKNATHLFLYLDQDLNSVADSYSIEFESQTGQTSLTFYAGSFTEGTGVDKGHTSGASGGLELSVATSVLGGSWVRVSIQVNNFTGPSAFSSWRGDMLVNIQ